MDNLEKRKLSVKKVDIISGKIKKTTTVVQLEPVSIGKLHVDGVAIKQKESEKVTLKNGEVKLKLKLKAYLELPIGGDVEFASKSTTVSFDLRTISLDTEGATIDIVSTETTDIESPPPVLGPLSLKGLKLDNITIESLLAPSEGLLLDGIQLGKLLLESLSLPLTTVNKVSIDEVHPKNDTIKIADIKLGPLAIPNTKIGTISAVIPKAIVTEREFTLDFDKRKKYGLKVKGKASIEINNLQIEFENLKITGSIQNLRIRDLEIPLVLKNTRLDGLSIESVSASSVAF